MKSQFANLCPEQISSHANFFPQVIYFKYHQCKKYMNQILPCLIRNFSALHVSKVLYVNINKLPLFACSAMVESFLFGFSRFKPTPLLIFIYLFLLVRLKMNLISLDQFRLTQDFERYWQLGLVLMLIIFQLSQTLPVILRIQEHLFSGCTVPAANKETKLRSSNISS